MTAIFWLIDTILGLVSFFLIANVIASWLMAFSVINSQQPLVRSLLNILFAMTEPILRPIRRVVPIMNGVDLSPLIALIAVYFVRILIMQDIRPMFM